MSKRAEEAALKAYPHYTAENLDDVIKARKFFAKGYEQAEKDLGWISVKDRLPEETPSEDLEKVAAKYELENRQSITILGRHRGCLHRRGKVASK